MTILPAHAYLDRHGIPYERRAFPPDTEKGAASVARALGFRERQMVKTLIFETDRGERVLVMLGGDQSAVSAHLKKVLENGTKALECRQCGEPYERIRKTEVQ